jgi:hypothetical protein
MLAAKYKQMRQARNLRAAQIGGQSAGENADVHKQVTEASSANDKLEKRGISTSSDEKEGEDEVHKAEEDDDDGPHDDEEDGDELDPSLCPNACSKHGVCNSHAECVCRKGYTGIDCSEELPELYEEEEVGTEAVLLEIPPITSLDLVDA